MIWGIVLICAFSAFSIFAQDAKKPDKKPKKFSGPNFSGTWVLDESRSYAIEVNVFKQKLPTPDPKRKITNILVIEQKDAEFKATIKRRTESFDDTGKPVNTDELVQSESVYYMDQRGETNKFQTDQTYSSVSTQNGREILVSITVDPKKRLYNIVTFSMSKDGKELVYKNSGYKLEQDYTRAGTYSSPTSLRSPKYYVKVP